MSRRITLSDEACALLGDLLSEEWLLREQLVTSDAEAMADWHRGLADLAANLYERITGHPLEAHAAQQSAREFERAVERTFGVKL